MDPQHLPLTDLAAADVEVWGLNGRPTTECGYSLPVLRDKQTDRFCLYSVTRAGGPRWDSRAEIEEQVRLGRVRPLPDPLGLPSFAKTPARQPVAAWASPPFLAELGGAGGSLPETGWVLQPVEVDRPGLYWICCSTADAITTLFDGWARAFVREFDARLVSELPAWPQLEQLADFGLCAARDPATRYQLFKRYCAAIYYRPSGSPERAHQVFRLLVRTEFKSLTWERFCEEMAVVVDRSREALRFSAATARAAEPTRRVAGRYPDTAKAPPPIRIEEFVAEVRDTELGPEVFTREIPHIGPKPLAKLDETGVIRPGTYVRGGDILVGKVAPKPPDQLTPEEQLMKAIFGRAGESVKNDSLQVPEGIEGVVVDARRSGRRVTVYIATSGVGDRARSPEAGDDLDLSVADLELSIRATNCLESEGISTVRGLVARTEEELLAVRNFGETTLREVKAKLQERGLRLRARASQSAAGPGAER